MSHWEVSSNWKPASTGFYTFSIMHVWWSEDYRGICILNFCLEWHRI
jgi:hypothetical protein